MPRHAGIDTPGTLHHVIVREIKKRGIVDDRWDRDTTVPFTIPACRQAGLLEPRALLSCAGSPRGVRPYMRFLFSGSSPGQAWLIALHSGFLQTPPHDVALLSRRSPAEGACRRLVLSLTSFR